MVFMTGKFEGAEAKDLRADDLAWVLRYRNSTPLDRAIANLEFSRRSKLHDLKKRKFRTEQFQRGTRNA